MHQHVLNDNEIIYRKNTYDILNMCDKEGFQIVKKKNIPKTQNKPKVKHNSNTTHITIPKPERVNSEAQSTVNQNENNNIKQENIITPSVKQTTNVTNMNATNTDTNNSDKPIIEQVTSSLPNKQNITINKVPYAGVLVLGDEPPKPPPIDGSDMKLNTNWILWIHPSESREWTAASYDKLTDIGTISKFWAVMNNFNNLDYKKNQFYLMRNGILPIWEDKNNRIGSTVSYRYDITQQICVDFWIDICMLTLNEMIYTNMKDITGLSFVSKNNWAIIKIWNSDGNTDISKNISDVITKKYPNHIPLHKRNIPEY